MQTLVFRVFPLSASRAFPLSASCAFLISLFLVAGATGQAVRFAGTTAVGGSAAPQAVPIKLRATGTIAAIKVRTAGSDGFDFKDAGGGSCTVGASFSAGQTCTLGVGFSPTAPGERRGAAVLLASDGSTLGSTLLGAGSSGALGVFVPGTIRTVAGNGLWIYAGDNVAATSAPLFLPFGVAVNAAGDLFVVDSSNGRVRAISAATGIISTMAGVGVSGATGDGGPAVAATINNPTGIAIDAAGDIFFADSGNNAIRRIDAFSGMITTVAGLLGSHGYGGDGTAATAATLSSPNGIALDSSGNLYIADTGNNVVRVVDAATGFIRTAAGTGIASYTGDGGPAVAATLNQPWGVGVSSAGTLLIADQGNNVVRQVAASGAISTVAGNGTSGFSGDGAAAVQAQLNVPSGVVVDVAGNIYVADTGNNRVRKINAVTGRISTVAGSGMESVSGDGLAADGAGIYGPYGLTLDGQGSLYVADVFHNRIRKVSSNAATLVYAPIRSGRISPPMLQTLENDGNAALHGSATTAGANSKIDLTGTTCSPAAALPPLGTCVLAVDFAPLTLGTLVQGTASLLSDAANSPSVVTVQGQVLDVDPTTLSVGSSSNPSVTGDAVVFTVTASSVGSTPTGTVTLLDGPTLLGTLKLSSGTANFTLSNLAAGTHSITASYGGDTSNAPGVSAALTQTVKEAVADTAITLSTNSNPVIAGAVLKLVAAVAETVAGSGAGTLSGSVTFLDGSNALGSAIVSNGTATLSVATLTPGQHALSAVYSGDVHYGASTSSPVAERVGVAITSTSLSSGVNPGNAGGSLSLAATVVGNGGVPTGLVVFLDGTTRLGSAIVDPAGVALATFSGAQWTVGVHTLTASYSGDAQNAASLSPLFRQAVQLAATTVALSSSQNPVGLGASVTFSAAVSGNGGTPSGSVQFFAGTSSLGTAVLNPAGQAALTTSTLPLGTTSISAVYAGDSYDGGASSAALNQAVQVATTAVLLAANKNPGLLGDPLLLTATVSGTGSVATGTVNFLEGATVIGSGVLTPAGTATLTTAALALGPHTLSASFSGDGVHASTLSAPLLETILQGTTTTLTASATQAFAGTTLTWTATVNGRNAQGGSNGAGVAGPVTLIEGSRVMTSLTSNAAGVATYSTASLAPGLHTLTAVFAGDTNDAPSTSGAATAAISIAATSTTLTSSANPALRGAAVTFTATLTGNGGIPAGSVSFSDGAVSLGTATLTASGSATLTVATLTPGPHSITALYSGDGNDGTSLSPALTEQINEQTALTLSANANPALLTDTVTLTATVSNGTVITPGGSVVLSDGGTTVGSASLSPAGLATFTLASPALGTHLLTASYSGDSRNTAATSPPLTETIVLRPTSSTFSASSTSITAGQSLVLVGVVLGAGSRPPTGAVVFSSGGAALGTATINASGVATLAVTPFQGSYNVVSTYSGDALFAPSVSSATAITVGPTVSFTLQTTPGSLTVQSGQHGTLSISMISAPTWADTLSLGCAGLPAYSTCTFSESSLQVSGGLAKTLTITVDTGNPLGLGGTAELHPPGTSYRAPGSLACLLPAGLLLFFAVRKRPLLRPLGLLLTLLLLGAALTTVSGCGNSLNQKSTPAGSYSFRIVGTGNKTGATQSAGVDLTVTP